MLVSNKVSLNLRQKKERLYETIGHSAHIFLDSNDLYIPNEGGIMNKSMSIKLSILLITSILSAYAFALTQPAVNLPKLTAGCCCDNVIEIGQTDFGVNGYTITSPGVYCLKSYIDWTPTGGAYNNTLYAITIAFEQRCA